MILFNYFVRSEKKNNLVTEPFCNKKVTWIYFRDNFET